MTLEIFKEPEIQKPQNCLLGHPIRKSKFFENKDTIFRPIVRHKSIFQARVNLSKCYILILNVVLYVSIHRIEHNETRNMIDQLRLRNYSHETEMI